MPRSRNRRKGRTRRSARPQQQHAGAPPARSPLPDELRANLPWLRQMLAVDAAEAAGDASRALELLQQMPHGPDGRPWWRPERVRRLRQLAALGEAAPAWVWGRWVVAQAAQPRPGRAVGADEVAVETRGGRSTLWGVDHPDAMAKVMEHDWVFRQLVLHEHGGLAEFVHHVASPALLDRVVDIGSWSGVPMGGYELLRERTDRIVWRDLRTGDVVETLNLGSASLMALGECAIGRLVRAADVVLFESAPLCVPPDVAQEVAGDPGRWLDTVAGGCRGDFGDLLTDMIAKAHHFDLLFDVSARLRRQLVQPLDPELRSDQLGSGGNGTEYDMALVLAALSGELPLAGDAAGGLPNDPDAGRPLAPLVSAALLEPGTVDVIRPLLVASDQPALRRMAGALTAPADLVCRRLCDELFAAA